MYFRANSQSCFYTSMHWPTQGSRYPGVWIRRRSYPSRPDSSTQWARLLCMFWAARLLVTVLLKWTKDLPGKGSDSWSFLQQFWPHGQMGAPMCFLSAKLPDTPQKQIPSPPFSSDSLSLLWLSMVGLPLFCQKKKSVSGSLQFLL